MKLAELGEFGLIERVRRHTALPPGTRLGIGDDCAVVEIPPGEVLLTSTDLLIEGVHFRRDWTDLFTLGRKCASVNLSDIAAMGGTPRQLYLGLALPPTLTVDDFDRLLAGVAAKGAEDGAGLAGGDTCRSPGPLLISVTVQGTAPADEIVTRSGARPGDLLYVSGTLGDSALALHILQQGGVPAAELAARHHDPRARVALGRELAKGRLATAMIDLSDGLVSDLGHLLRASAVGARVEIEKIPRSPAFAAASDNDRALAELAISGGEDYELLFTAPAGSERSLAALSEGCGVALTRIGRIVSPQGLELLDAAGKCVIPGHGGFNHFMVEGSRG